MREFARICVGFGEQLHRSDISHELERILNAEVVIKRKNSDPAIDLSKSEADMHPVHPYILSNPNFQFSAAVHKMRRIDEYAGLKHALAQSREVRAILESAADGRDSLTKEKLSSSFNELNRILEELDRDTSTFTGTSKISDWPVFHRLKKTHFAINEMVTSFFKDGFGMEGIDYENVEQVYDPMRTGCGSLYAANRYLVSQGMSPEMSRELCRRYLNKLAEKGNHHCSLMDFFCDRESKKALHDD
jgi:hypothetical protein